MATNAAIAQFVLAKTWKMRSKIMKKNEIRTQRTPLSILLLAIIVMITGSGVSAQPFSEEQLQVSGAAKTGKSQVKTVVKSSGPRARVNSALEGSRYYRPIAEWSGQLIHPSIDRRDPAGGIPFKIEQSPDRSLIGKTVWLRWDTSEPWEQWF